MNDYARGWKPRALARGVHSLAGLCILLAIILPLVLKYGIVEHPSAPARDWMSLVVDQYGISAALVLIAGILVVSGNRRRRIMKSN